PSGASSPMTISTSSRAIAASSPAACRNATARRKTKRNARSTTGFRATDPQPDEGAPFQRGFFFVQSNRSRLASSATTRQGPVRFTDGVSMKTIFSPRHSGHAGNVELEDGRIVPAYEKPSRAEIIRARIDAVSLGPVAEPDEHDLETAAKVHSRDYLDFLPTVWPEWEKSGRSGTAMPFAWPTRGLRGDVPPRSIIARLGFYSFDAGATFVKGTWDAIKSSQDTALTAAELIRSGERSAFALCRPPGHHAGSNFMGGYCFINNAAVAAQRLLDGGARR